MNKFNLKVKKNILVSILGVLVIGLGMVLVASITKEHKAKDAQAFVKDNKIIDVKDDSTKDNNSSKAIVPVIASDEKTEKPIEDKQLDSNSETPKKADKVIKPEPPKEKPKTSDDLTNKNKVPTYPEKEVKPQSQPPKGGEANNKGQGNFPGFGTVEDGGVNKGENVNSSGDINKQVGKMD